MRFSSSLLTSLSPVTPFKYCLLSSPIRFLTFFISFYVFVMDFHSYFLWVLFKSAFFYFSRHYFWKALGVIHSLYFCSLFPKTYIHGNCWKFCKMFCTHSTNVIACSLWKMFKLPRTAKMSVLNCLMEAKTQRKFIINIRNR